MKHRMFESVSIQHIAQMVIGLTLADKPVPRTNRDLFERWALLKEAHEWVVRINDIEVQFLEVTPQSSDGFYFSVEIMWFIGCDLCELESVEWTWSNTPLCNAHWRDGQAAEKADLENDDRALGL